MNTKSVTLIAALVLATPATANDVVTQIPVTDKFVDGALLWDDGRSSYDYRATLTQSNGRMLLCGAGVYRDSQRRSATDRWLRSGKVTVDGEIRVQGFRFFTKVRSLNRLASANANCVDAGPVPTRNQDLDVSFGGVTWRN